MLAPLNLLSSLVKLDVCSEMPFSIQVAVAQIENHGGTVSVAKEIYPLSAVGVHLHQKALKLAKTCIAKRRNQHISSCPRAEGLKEVDFFLKYIEMF